MPELLFAVLSAAREASRVPNKIVGISLRATGGCRTPAFADFFNDVQSCLEVPSKKTVEAADEPEGLERRICQKIRTKGLRNFTTLRRTRTKLRRCITDKKTIRQRTNIPGKL